MKYSYYIVQTSPDLFLRQDGADGGYYEGRGAAFWRVLRKLRRTYPQITGRFWRSDGSCPDTYTIYFNN